MKTDRLSIDELINRLPPEGWEKQVKEKIVISDADQRLDKIDVTSILFIKIDQ